MLRPLVPPQKSCHGTCKRHRLSGRLVLTSDVPLGATYPPTGRDIYTFFVFYFPIFRFVTMYTQRGCKDIIDTFCCCMSLVHERGKYKGAMRRPEASGNNWQGVHMAWQIMMVHPTQHTAPAHCFIFTSTCVVK